jgi:hypothetical protein
LHRISKHPNVGVARARLGGLQSIGSTQDFGNGLTSDAFATLLAQTEAAILTYNRLFGELDSARRTMRLLEAELADMSDRIFKAVAAYYGTSSDEYGKVGGIPKRERRRRSRRVVEPAASADVAPVGG